MLNRLQLFRNVGLFDTVYPPSNLGLARLTLIYAENGRGKTTLSAILRSLANGTALPIIERPRLGSQHPPHIVINCDGGSSPAIFLNGAWSRSVPTITIFDDTFIDENICSGLVIASEHRQRLHEFILGAQGVALNRALLTAVDDVETHNRVLRAKADAIPPTERGTFSVDAFCALASRDEIDDAIREAERNLAAAQEQDDIKAAQGFTPFSLPQIDVDELSAVLRTQLADLEEAAAQTVQAHLAKIGDGGEAWIAAGMGRVNAASLKDCPFCGQDLRASEIVNHYRGYFSEAYAGLKKEVAERSRSSTTCMEAARRSCSSAPSVSSESDGNSGHASRKFPKSRSTLPRSIGPGPRRKLPSLLPSELSRTTRWNAWRLNPAHWR